MFSKESGFQLETNNFAFPASRSGDRESPVFTLCSRAVLNGAQTEHTQTRLPGDPPSRSGAQGALAMIAAFVCARLITPHPVCVPFFAGD